MQSQIPARLTFSCASICSYFYLICLYFLKAPRFRLNGFFCFIMVGWICLNSFWLVYASLWCSGKWTWTWSMSYVKLSRKYARSLFLCCAGFLLKMNESSDWSLSRWHYICVNHDNVMSWLLRPGHDMHLISKKERFVMKTSKVLIISRKVYQAYQPLQCQIWCQQR